jgi:hypothetical protein
MGRTTDTLANFVVFFTAAYGVASRFRDRRDALRLAAVVGLVGATINWLGYEKPDVLEESDDAEAVEIEI